LLPVLSDPFGWGWDLLGTSNAIWTPYLSQYVPILQAFVLIGGLFWSASKSKQIADELKAPRQALPIIFFCSFITISLLWLFVG
jgi:hypothetical protein